MNSVIDELKTTLSLGKDLIVFDTETTGFSTERDRIIQFSGIRYRNTDGSYREIRRFCRYIRPERQVSRQITDLTGITNAFLSDQPGEKEVFDDIADFMRDAILVGHNVSFDLRMTGALYKRCGSYFSADLTLDTLKLAKAILPGAGSYKLCDLAALTEADKGLTFHNANDDVIATARIFWGLVWHIMENDKDIQ